MRKSTIIFLALMAIRLTGQTDAETPFSSFDVYVYPEYSHPGVGIIIEGVALPGKTPRFFEIEVPGETTIALLRLGDKDDGAAQRVEISQRDGKAYLPVDLTDPRFQVQYFFNPFESDSGPRAFDFAFSINEEMDEIHFTLQRPIHAENFTHTLPEAEQVDGDYGMVFYREHKEGLKAGEVHTFSVAYSNPSGTLSITTLEELVSERQNSPRADAVDPTDMKPMLLVGLLLVVGLIVTFKFIRPSGTTTALAATPQAVNTVPDGGKTKAGAKFCSSCGAPRRDGGKFCHECGKEY